MIRTPYYLIDKSKLIRNMEIITCLREMSGAKILLALKCFATWSLFDLMSEYMDGTTSSSLYELRLGREKFGKETHAYSVAWADNEIDEACSYADKIIFNSIQQLQRFANTTKTIQRGLRLNPGISASNFDLANPSRPFSRLGETNQSAIKEVLPLINGLMIHNNCENADFNLFNQMLNHMEEKFAELFAAVDWISLGGGIHFTAENYPLEALAKRLKNFSQTYGVTIFLEPGEAAITKSTTLEVSVLDTLYNEKNLAIVDSSIEAHMLDLLIYRESAKLEPNKGPHEIMVCGKSCLAGDVFGTFQFPEPLKVGDRLSFQDAAGYTMVKKNWFNGVSMPAIVIKECSGALTIQRQFSYNDYQKSLS
ncbi:Diaminopimelate decarboxylase [Candidatus Bartonella washoeensis]|uniref:Carboxynorspermidine/carboxyspermidine decarboxylase n=2 Tax=Candidatus Bartonella washoeensis TaxID=186739 RepID=J0ZBC0_9HYPH|nr:carboxynorspermidine decarboxylase [Bartonella washoeensis]EJF79212.1 carboxynorspermidine decarboxylase [Bartonella washoeensis Sb944nv]EJF85183.1 carboxynorspermidine decarboxylase [Bartonella washoeensis 085-0475]SPU28019.1 Diaminopimelate decarboxylase [Bartonella washoeensis]